MGSGGDRIMNNKGFTLIELLATLVILSLVLSISAYGIVGVINRSRARGEELFVSKLSKVIDDYVSLNGSRMVHSGEEIKFTKKNNIGDSTYEVSMYLLKKSDGKSVYVLDLVSEGLVDQAKLINPKNKKACFDEENNPEVKIYRDSDYVYYYFVNLENNLCDLGDDAVVNTLPSGVNP